jgi:hypothetical protein
MNTIKKENVKKEVEQLNNLLKTHTKVTEKLYNILYKKGYTIHDLGKGKCSYIRSKEVKIMDIKTRNTRKYIKPGKYIIIGLCNYNYIYRGLVKEIV